ncbi:MAG: copper homeostasis protein CutC [Flavobacterium sp.]|uniref:copper homeostasis protein CutC n=1 Tax=unclassified Flavobacterium TaxID=196869 RepID=UPI001292B2AB|nr:MULTISPECIES: copper homeostasis protein CutC [unclassified Flavobacterium]MDP5002252.1 copper homeostasis protein CutC [Flavobacterium sp.]MDP5027247.1 copper homeostasis protein CutC [Flavobacterium sp.]MQP53350.1 copper homeostasis protein CutC [Flavobacterium sp. LMO9]MQP62214.1 copper homeostasis protein CutC [Flavobacterium sp. LMO6]
MLQNKKIEIACFNLESTLIAQKAGADRVELCADMSVGGTTPVIETIQQARKNLTIDLYVMIRPRGGNFVYSDSELEQMKFEIETIKKLGINGFVFGILKEDRTINIEQNKALIDIAKPFPCTFHRAFDEVLDYGQALENVISCGFSTILTSGTIPNVMEGKEVLKQLVIRAKNRIEIMPGGGLRSTNISELNEMVNANWYHSSAITDGSEIANPEEIIQLKKKLQS